MKNEEKRQKDKKWFFEKKNKKCNIFVIKNKNKKQEPSIFNGFDKKVV